MTTARFVPGAGKWIERRGWGGMCREPNVEMDGGRRAQQPLTAEVLSTRPELSMACTAKHGPLLAV